MFRSRAVQYLGLVLLVLASFGVIFFPLGPAPTPQEYTIHLTAPKSWEELATAAGKTDKALAGKTAAAIADAAFVKEFPKPPLPKQLTIAPDGKEATIVDTADDRITAQERSQRIKQALQKSFPGVTLTAQTEDAIEILPVRPLFRLGQTAVFPYQSNTAIKLGLDLRGGVSLVLQVRRALFTYSFDPKFAVTDIARESLLTKVRESLSKTDPSLKLDQADVNFAPGGISQLEVRTQAENETVFNAQAKAIDAALAGIAEAAIKPARAPQFFQPKLKEGEKLDADFEKQRLARTVEIIRSRVDKLGVSEPQIQSQGNSRIVVQLPGLKDPQKAVEVVGTTARMEIRLLPESLTPDYSNPDNITFRDAKTGAPVPSSVARERSELVVEGEDVKPTTTAGPAGDMSSKMAVSFELQGDGSRRFADVTRKVAGKDRIIPIFLDERCISAPTVETPITGGHGQISGNFTIDEARQLALLLNSGALPAPIDVVENRTVSATLGSDSLKKSLNAGIIGLMCVAVFMIVFYRLPGMLANCALAVYLLINLASFILIGGTLTLPGVAGFLLAIAMSLDTNILVFERMHEEMAIQPTFAASLRAAFSRAWTAILDSHVTTLVAATVLFNFGTGPVKGFALTLGIGVLLSLFSAISVTRLFMWSVSGIGEKNPGLFGKPTPNAPSTVVTK